MSGGWAVAIAFGTLLTACGGGSGESRDDGGIAGAGGTGPAPQGSLYIEIGSAVA